MSISCANCASVALAGSPYQRCAGCKQVSYCSKGCQKMHWKHHKTFCKQQQQQQHTSAPSSATINPRGSDHGTGNDDNGGQTIASAPSRLLTFLRTPPFPGLNLSIDGSPVAIVDTSRSAYNENTDKTNLTGAVAIATVLWNWHPNALRAFLDRERYSSFAFIISEEWPRFNRTIVYAIVRDNRRVDFGNIHYETGQSHREDLDWRQVSSYKMPKKGRWKPIHGSDGQYDSDEPSWVHTTSGIWARCQMNNCRWKPASNRIIRLQLNNLGVDLASLQQQYTSAPSNTAGVPFEFIDDDEDTDPDGTDYDDEDDDDEDDDDEDDDDDFDDETPRPLAFLRTRPFPNLDLSIDGSPIAIVDTGAYVEETIKTDLTAAIATATILWNWHPNALRAFLDCQKYSAFEFATCDKAPGAERYVTHMISRHDRAILIGHYDQDFDWGVQVSYGLLEDGRWKPLWGSTNVLPGKDKPEWVNKIGNMWAKDELYFKPWLSRRNREQELTLGGGKVDPASLYRESLQR
ncbi:hypothetical protein KCU78_g558, partial [Aureobasidium melanogenum]